MATVTVSPKFQVVIPEEVRTGIGLQPGEKLEVLRRGNVIYMVRVRPITDFRGAFPGIDTDVPRDDDRV